MPHKDYSHLHLPCDSVSRYVLPGRMRQSPKILHRGGSFIHPQNRSTYSRYIQDSLRRIVLKNPNPSRLYRRLAALLFYPTDPDASREGSRVPFLCCSDPNHHNLSQIAGLPFMSRTSITVSHREFAKKCIRSRVPLSVENDEGLSHVKG